MTSADRRLSWKDFEAYADSSSDWHSVLVGKSVQADGREAHVDVVYYDHQNALYKVRIRFADKSSSTFAAAEWSGLDGQLEFPGEATFEIPGKTSDEHADLAEALQATFGETGDPWLISRASREWRKAGSPGDALRVTSIHPDLIGDAKAAALTSRGGALCDLARWEEARACAHEAKEVCERETHHVHMLLMRIHLNLGETARADEALSRARMLGLSERGEQGSLRKYLAEIRDNGQRLQVIRNLIGINPDRYGHLATMRATE